NLRVIESDFQAEAKITSRSALRSHIGYMTCRKLTQFFYALSPKLRLVSRPYLVKPERRPDRPCWGSDLTKIFNLINTYLAFLARSPHGRPDFDSEEVFDLQTWSGCYDMLIMGSFALIS
ncbi:hypothetical protein FRC12_022193, partial [Ceratobasidium sp. 428]